MVAHHPEDGPSSVIIHTLADASESVVAQDSLITWLDWSPDGSEIAYGTGRGMARVGVEGGISRPIPGPRDPMYIRWLRDGRILFSDRKLNKYRNYSLVDPATGQMTSLPLDSRRGTVFQFAVAPDERTLAAAGNRGDQDDLKVWLIDIDDGDERLLYDGWAAPFAWSADGRWVYLITERLPYPAEGPRSCVLRVSADGAVVEDVVDLITPILQWGYISMSRDGRRIACSQRRTGNDLWLMDVRPGGD
jgi:Tol biopolymer transport system component